MAITTGVGIIDDLQRLFDNPSLFPQFCLYKQDDPNAVAVKFTDIRNNFVDHLQIELVHQPIESSQIINPYMRIKPRIVSAQIVFLPYSPVQFFSQLRTKTDGVADIMSQMEDVKNQAEQYMLNRDLVIIKREYPLVKQYSNMKIIDLKQNINLQSVNYLSYDIIFEQVIGYNATNGQVKSNQVTDPTNSSTVKTK